MPADVLPMTHNKNYHVRRNMDHLIESEDGEYGSLLVNSHNEFIDKKMELEIGWAVT